MIATERIRKVRGEGWLAKRVGRVTGYTILILTSLFLFMPIFWLLVASLKVDAEYMTWPIQWFPAKVQWVNYANIFKMTPFAQIAGRTFGIGITVAVIRTFVDAMVGFAFARYKVPGSGKLFSILVATMLVPWIVYLIPTFLIYSYLHLTNTYWPWYISAMAGDAFGIFLFRQFFMNFPQELEEAAEVDGAGPWRIFLQIFLPNAKPVLAVSMILGFQNVWSDYLTPLLYLNFDKTFLAVALQFAFRNPMGYEYKTLTLAANVIYMLPLIIAFFMAQKYILKGIVTSGLKG
jgi:ABC-type glycerol-3-phosphate transport system permease component